MALDKWPNEMLFLPPEIVDMIANLLTSECCVRLGQVSRTSWLELVADATVTIKLCPAAGCGPQMKLLSSISAVLRRLKIKLLSRNNVVLDISPLGGLINLAWLDLSHTNVEDISPLGGLSNLAWLDLSHTNVEDISPLGGLSNLAWLDLNKTNFRDISPLGGLTNLTHLKFELDEVEAAEIDISPLTALTNLEELQLGYRR
jgi:hypothetical protein